MFDFQFGCFAERRVLANPSEVAGREIAADFGSSSVFEGEQRTAGGDKITFLDRFADNDPVVGSHHGRALQVRLCCLDFALRKLDRSLQAVNAFANEFERTLAIAKLSFGVQLIAFGLVVLGF